MLASAAGAPGVTTAAVGLTLTWQRSVVMVDADPGAYQAVLAGYLRGQVPTAKGLQRVAEAHRDRRPLLEVVSDETIALTADDGAPSAGTTRRLLPGFVKAANAALFAPVWPDLADTFVRYEDAGIDVIVDAGRLDRAGLPQPLVDRADVVALVTRSNLRSIAAARGAAVRLIEQSRLTGNESNLGLILVGENDPYGRREIGKLLAIPVLSMIADDPETARVFSDGARRGRKFDRAPLVRSLHRTAEELTGEVRRRRARLGLEPDRMPDRQTAVAFPVDDVSSPAVSPSRPAGSEQSQCAPAASTVTAATATTATATTTPATTAAAVPQTAAAPIRRRHRRRPARPGNRPRRRRR